MKHLFLIVLLFILPMLACAIPSTEGLEFDEVLGFLALLQLEMVTTIQEDGTGEMELGIGSNVKDEDGEYLVDCTESDFGELPPGSTVTVEVIEGLRWCRIRYAFASLADLRAAMEDPGAEGDEESSPEMLPSCMLLDEGVLYYEVDLADDGLFPSGDTAGSSGDDQAASASIPFILTAPGPIHFHNAEQRDGNTLQWNLLAETDAIRINLAAGAPCPDRLVVLDLHIRPDGGGDVKVTVPVPPSLEDSLLPDNIQTLLRVSGWTTSLQGEQGELKKVVGVRSFSASSLDYMLGVPGLAGSASALDLEISNGQHTLDLALDMSRYADEWFTLLGEQPTPWLIVGVTPAGVVQHATGDWAGPDPPLVLLWDPANSPERLSGRVISMLADPPVLDTTPVTPTVAVTPTPAVSPTLAVAEPTVTVTPPSTATTAPVAPESTPVTPADTIRPANPDARPDPASTALLDLNPTSGQPGADVNAGGSGFPANRPVKLTWDAPDGEELGTAQSDDAGEFEVAIVIPAGVRPGIYRVYATSGSVTAVATFVVEKCLRGQVRIRLLEGLPVGHVPVELFGYEAATGTRYNAGLGVTDLEGHYEVCSADLVLFPDDLYYLRISFVETDFAQTQPFGIVMLDESTAQPARGGGLDQSVFQVTVGDGGELGVSDPGYYFPVNTHADPAAHLERDVWIYQGQDNLDTPDIREDHTYEAAILYYHSFQAARFFDSQMGSPLPRGDSVNFNTLQIVNNGTPVWFHSTECDACTNVSGIFYDDIGSVWNDGNGPRNREYHEMAHWLMLRQYGEFPPRLAEPSDFDFNGNQIIDEDINHSEARRGYRNQLSSSDAWSEGFAEFLAMVIAYHYRNLAPEPFWQDLLPPYVYTVGHPNPYMLNIELNGVHFYEEFEVAALLWDIYDPANPAEDDGLQVPIQTIWEELRKTHDLPVYYTLSDYFVTGFTGDEHAYPTDPLTRESHTDSCSAISDPPLVYPQRQRHIYFVKDLYDVLSRALPNAEVTDLFKAHGFFLNSYLIYTDYQLLPPLIPIQDGPTRVLSEFTEAAGHNFWTQGLAVEVQNQGWGAGVLFDQAVDARGFGYLWMWINTDGPLSMSMVLEDQNGEWLAPFSSADTGWELYVIPLVKNPGGGLNQGFTPNPNRNTPPAAAQISLETIRRLGLVVHEEGSRVLNLGAVAFTHGYPWKPGMCQIVGIGDFAGAPFLPYRRDMPPLPGATAQIKVNQVPATLMVGVQYGPPYEDFSFSYPVELTDESTVVGLFVEQGRGETQNRLTLFVEKEGFESSASVTLDSSTYWERLEAGESVLSATFELEPEQAVGIPDDLVYAAEVLSAYTGYLDFELGEEGDYEFMATDFTIVRTDGPAGFDIEVDMRLSSIAAGEEPEDVRVELYLVGDRMATFFGGGDSSFGARDEFPDGTHVSFLIDHASEQFSIRGLLDKLGPAWQPVETVVFAGIDATRYELVEPDAEFFSDIPVAEILVADLWIAQDGNYVVGFKFEAVDDNTGNILYTEYALDNINAALSIEIPE